MCILLALAGAVLFVGAAIADPFAIPFQDFEALPEEAKDRYFRKAEFARYVRHGGGALVVLSLVALWLPSGRKRTAKSL